MSDKSMATENALIPASMKEGWKPVSMTRTHTIFEHRDGHRIELCDGGLMKYCKGGMLQNFDEGTPDGVVEPALSPDADNPLFSLPVDTGTATNEPSQLIPQTPVASEPTPLAAPSDGVGAPPGEPSAPSAPPLNTFSPSPNDPYGIETQNKILGTGLNNQLQGIAEEAAAKSREGKAESQILGQAAAAQTNELQDFKSHEADLQARRDAATADLRAGHIDPERYYKNMSTGSKILNGIGLILGGMGAGRGENPVLAMIQKSVDRDIDAQKSDINNKHTLLSANLEDFHNLHEATQMTKVMMNDAVATQLKQAAATAQSPMAAAAAHQAAGALEAQNAGVISQLAMRRTMLGGGGTSASGARRAPDPAQMVMAIVPKEDQKDALKEIKEQQNINRANASALDSFDKVSKLQTLAARTKNPLQSYKQIDAEWDPMMDKLTKTTEGRVTPITLDLMNHLKPEVTDTAETLALKRQKLGEILNAERSTPTLNAFRIQVPNTTAFTNEGASRFTPGAPVRPGA